MTKLLSIEGIGEKSAEKLKAAGITTADALLEKGLTPKARKEIAEKSGIDEGLILQWINHVDLFRIKGVGEEYSDLLEAAGVDTIPELAQRKAENLYAKLVATNEEKKLVRKLPVLSQVTSWVEQAKCLPRKINY
jgi:predicted flap endonuclease-1-like 5' DNA nuclease